MNNFKKIRKITVTNEFRALLHNFVPKHAPADNSDIKSLENFIKNSKKIFVLTGAGISTESGIPDYRSEEVGLYARTNHKPIQYQEFLKSVKLRQRYWARNFIGWPTFSTREPNETHFALKKLEDAGKITCVVTQNVDSLHSKAGSKNVVELHGTAFRVICLECEASYDRHYIQDKLITDNPTFTEFTQMVRPDGDVDISQEKIKDFRPPLCENCRGVLKPDITFFGDNVPRSRVDLVRGFVSASDSVLVLGSSLTVFSGYRILLQAAEEDKNVAIVNIGATRGDKLAHLKISAKCGEILPRIR